MGFFTAVKALIEHVASQQVTPFITYLAAMTEAQDEPSLLNFSFTAKQRVSR